MGIPRTEGVEVNDFPAIKAAWYDAVLLGGEDDVDKNGDSYTKLHFGLEGSNRQAWCNLSHRADFLWKVKQFKMAIVMADSEEDLTQHFGTRLRIYCQNKEYQGKNYAEVTQFKSFDSVVVEEPTPAVDKDDLPF